MGKKSAKVATDEIERIKAQILEVIEPLVPGKFFMVAVDFEQEAGRWYLRLYLEGRGFKISLNDCETVSRLLDEPLERLSCLEPFSYVLEVSSPGAFREIKTSREFDFFKNREVAVFSAKGGKEKSDKAKIKATPIQYGLIHEYNPVTQTLTLKENHAAEAPFFQVCLKDDAYTIQLHSVLDFPETLTVDNIG